MLKYKLLILLLISGLSAVAQKGIVMNKYFITGSASVGANEANVFSDICAWLEIGKDSTDRGLLLPRVVDTGDIDSPKYGLVVYQIADSLPYFYNGASWMAFTTTTGSGPADTPTLQDVITAGNTLTANNVIYDTGYHFGIMGADSFYVNLYGSDVALVLDTTNKTAYLNAHTFAAGDKNGTANGTVINLNDNTQTIAFNAPTLQFSNLNTYSTGAISGLVRANTGGNVYKIATYPASLVGTGTSGFLKYGTTASFTAIDTSDISGLHNYFLQKTDTGRKLTINGTQYSLSADRSWSVGTVTSIGTTAPLSGGTITGSGTISITQSGTGTDGYLSSADWNTFNGKQDVKISSSINLKATGNTTVFTTSASHGYFIITQVLVYTETLTGAGSAAQISVGQTATAYTDIVANTALTAIAATPRYQPLTLVVPPNAIPPSTAVVVKVNSASTYTTNTGRVAVIGFYLSP